MALLVSCGHGSGPGPKPSATTTPSGYVPKGAWDAAYFKTLRGLTGSFRSLVVGTPCTEPITKPCVVGGAQISDTGVFTLAQDSARYEHRAYGLSADPGEANGYRVLLLENGDMFLSQMGRTSRGGCWAKTYSPTTFGSKWSVMPVGFEILLNADAQSDPAIATKAQRFSGLADTGLVLDFLGLGGLYHDYAGHYHWEHSRVPIELRVGANGLPAGFAVDGTQVAEHLVGPDPAGQTNAPAAFAGSAEDLAYDAEVRHSLAPMRGEFSLVRLGTKNSLEAPPKNRLLTRPATGNDPCPGGS